MNQIKFDKNYLFIFFISLFLILPLINNLYFEGHDTGYHIANILAISDNLSYHNILTLKIFPLIANNFGYGSGIFYPQLSHIWAAIIYKIITPWNLSVFSAIKITNFIVIFLSGILMYHFMKVVTKNKSLSFLSTLLYLTAPYKLYDYIVRDALAESFVFIFIPLVFLGVYYLLNKNYKKFYICFVIGYVGLINSHLVMTIYITLFLGLILLTQWSKIWQKENIKHFFKATGLVILICLPFIIPLLEHKLYGSYVVFSKNAMANPGGVYWNGLRFKQYFIGNHQTIGYHFLNYFTIFFLIYILKKSQNIKNIFKKMRENYLFATGIICTVLGIWMSSLLFPWVIMPDFLLMIQFPWRLGTMTLFGLSILSYEALKDMQSHKKALKNLTILSCFIVALFCLYTENYKYLTPNDYNLSDIGMGWQKEYLPLNTYQNIDYFNSRNNEVILKDGNAEIGDYEDNLPNLTFKAENVSNATLELPRLYYLGYQIKAIYDTSEEEIPYYENDNGFIEINLEKSAIIVVEYTGTKINQIGNIISILSILVFGLSIIFMKSVGIEYDQKES